MKKLIIISAIFTFLFIGTTYAQVSIKAEVDKTKISTDETITYKLAVISSQKNTPKPQLPDFKGFSVISQAQSSTISFKKREFEIMLVYVYILSPAAPGKFNIGPSSIKLEGNTYSTDSFQIEVTQGKGQPQGQTPEEPTLPQEPSQSEQPKVTL